MVEKIASPVLISMHRQLYLIVDTGCQRYLFFMRDQLAGMVEDIASPVLIPMHRRVHFKVDSKMYGTIYATCFNLGGCSFLVARFWPYHFCRIFLVCRVLCTDKILQHSTQMPFGQKFYHPGGSMLVRPPFPPRFNVDRSAKQATTGNRAGSTGVSHQKKNWQRDSPMLGPNQY